MPAISKLIRSVTAVVLLVSPPLLVAEEFTYRFATADFEPLVFRSIGAKSGHPGKQTAEGVVLTAPSEQTKKSQVGYATRFAITGDFEITVSYDLLEVSKPEKGYGTGFMVKLFKTDNERLNFSRSLKSDGEQKFSTAIWIKKKGSWVPEVERIPAGETSGELKLIRKGPRVTFLAREGDSPEFIQIREVTFGVEPITRLELLCDTGGDQQPAKVLLKQLTVSADELFESNRKVPEVKPFWTTWTMAGTAGALLVIVLGSVIWYQRR